MTSVSKKVRERIRKQAGDRCGYCKSAQMYTSQAFEIDHIQPLSQGGEDTENNLWLACRMCNGYKGSQIDAVDPDTGERVRLFNPRKDIWADHFHWGENGLRIIGISACGRATAIALHLNNYYAVTARRFWIQANWHPPTI